MATEVRESIVGQQARPARFEALPPEVEGLPIPWLRAFCVPRGGKEGEVEGQPSYQLNIRTGPETLFELRAVAELRGVSKAEVVRRAIAQAYQETVMRTRKEVANGGG